MRYLGLTKPPREYIKREYEIVEINGAWYARKTENTTKEKS